MKTRFVPAKHPVRFLLVSACLIALTACGGGGGSSPSGTSGTSTGGASASAPVKATVSGTVLQKNGAPLAGVTVSVFHHNTLVTLTAITDANGAYAVAGLDTVNNADYGIYAEKAGFGFYPSVADPAGEVGKLDFNGLYRTLIRFLALPAHDVASASANFTAYGPGDKVASLPRTGQSTSYAAGDDFAKQAGVAWPGTRFTDNANGTVTDHLSGLIWLKNAGCASPSTWAAALSSANQLASGACGLSDGSLAGQWRMPNANELESLVDVSRTNPAVAAAAPFTNVQLSNAYWSSTTYTALTSNAMAIRFSDGRWINGIDLGDASFNNAKTTSLNSLWAVKSGPAGTIQVLATGVYAGTGGGSFGAADDALLRLGAPLTSPRFIDNRNGTLSDTVTGLTWLKQADCLHANWAGVLSAVNNLASGTCGLDDGSRAGQWRVPNRQELLSLSDRAPTFPQASYFNGQYGSAGVTTGPVIFDRFIVSDYYWTSTTDAADTAQAWAIYSCDFGVYNVAKSDIKYALAVR